MSAPTTPSPRASLYFFSLTPRSPPPPTTDPFTDHGTSGVKVNGHVLPATTNGLATPMKTALTTYPLFLEVRNVSVDENGKGLPNIMYEAAFKAPSLNVEWSVKYRFAHFRDIFHALEPHCVYAGDDAQRRQESGALEMTSAFPRTHTRRSLGIPLTERQLQERTALLGRWLRELLSKRGKLPIPMQSTVCSFMKLDEKLGDKIGMIVVSKPPKGEPPPSSPCLPRVPPFILFLCSYPSPPAHTRCVARHGSDVGGHGGRVGLGGRWRQRRTRARACARERRHCEADVDR